MYEYNAKVVRILDADSIIVDIDLGFNIILNNHYIRLEGIDAPELRSKNKIEKEAALVAKKFVEDRISVGDNIYIKIYPNKYDKFGRTLGTIFTKEYENINENLLKNKLVVKYTGQSTKQLKIDHETNLKTLVEMNVINQTGYT